MNYAPREFVSDCAPLAPKPQPQGRPTGGPAVGGAYSAAEGAALPPSSNRGESEDEAGDSWVEQTTSIDWLSFCLSLPALLVACGVAKPLRTLERLASEADSNTAEIVALIIFKWCGFDAAGLRFDGKPAAGRFHTWRVKLKDRADNFAGCIEFAGEHTKLKCGDETVRVELTGRGAAQFEGRTASGAHRRRPWATLRAQLESGPPAWLTRVDVACDLYNGQITVRDAERWWEEGQFNNRGQRPHAQLIDDKGSKKGCTFNVGSRQSPKLLRIYEKGRELGKKDSEWVRFEGQFNVAGGFIDMDILTNPGAALRGGWKPLTFVADVANRVYQYKARAEICAQRALIFMKKQYGATLGFLRANLDADAFMVAVHKIARDKTPGWSREPLERDEWPPILAAAH